MSEFEETQCRGCTKREGKAIYKMNCLFTPTGLKAKLCRLCQSKANGARYGRNDKRPDGATVGFFFPKHEQLPARSK